MKFHEEKERENRLRLIQTLIEKPLSYREVVENTGLASSTVNRHLKILREEGKINKVFRSGQFVNEIQLDNIDAVEFFLEKLKPIGVPDDVIDRGRPILSENELFQSHFHYELIKRSIQKENSQLPDSVYNYILNKTPLSSNSDYNDFKIQIMEELGPFNFHVFLTVYEVFREYYSGHEIKPEIPYRIDKVPEEIAMCCLFTEPFEEIKAKIDKIYDWWFNEVAPHSNISEFLKLLIIAYYEKIDLKRKINNTK